MTILASHQAAPPTFYNKIAPMGRRAFKEYILIDLDKTTLKNSMIVAIDIQFTVAQVKHA